MEADSKTRDVWTSIFRRKGGVKNSTGLWADWDENVRSTVLKGVQLESSELPVILSKPGSPNQLLLTTRRLLCRNGVVDVDRVAEVGPVDVTRKTKSQLDELEIEISAGTPLRITLEPGPSYLAFWSVLLNIARRNKHRSTGSPTEEDDT
jgi:hypothetical protein